MLIQGECGINLFLYIDWSGIKIYIHHMSRSIPSIQDILGPGGLLANSMHSFEVRTSQIEMAHMIADCLENGLSAVAEAGTGTGKTLGYLVPVILSGRKTIISTGTKNLQEQIFFKDVPLLREVFPFQIDAMLMKGRSNYLCLYRYHQYFSRPSLFKDSKGKLRKKIDRWIEKTEFADRAELPWLRDDDPLWDSISSTTEQCVGGNCPFYEDCFLNRLRARAAQSRLIIVNHHLFCADIKLKMDGFGEIIPRFQAAVFDEAHEFEDICSSHLGERLGTKQLLDLAMDWEDSVRSIKGEARSLVMPAILEINGGVEGLRSYFEKKKDRDRMHETVLLELNEGPVRAIKSGLDKLSIKALEKRSSFQPLIRRAEDLKGCLEKIFSTRGNDWLNWYERRSKSILFYASPLNVSDILNEALYERVKTVIYTSATLATAGNFEFMRSRLGLHKEIKEAIYPSHFDFSNQTLLYIPKDLPLPVQSGFPDEVSKRALEVFLITQGRALLLFTSKKNMNLAYSYLKEKIPYSIFLQGDAPRTVLLERFREDVHSVLLATGSFWQGVDVPGESLSCLIVDKLPFDSPSDPLVAAKIDSIRAGGGNPFMEYQLPSAIIALKQGLGRLVRKNSDRGVLSVMDSRILTSRYGRFFIESLPEMPISHDLEDIKRFFSSSGSPEQ